VWRRAATLRQTRLDHCIGPGTVAVVCHPGFVGFWKRLAVQGHAGVLDVIPEFDPLAIVDAVIDDLGCAEFLFEHHVAALGGRAVTAHGVVRGLCRCLFSRPVGRSRYK